MSGTSVAAQPLIRLEEALEQMLDGLAALPPRRLPLDQAHGLVLAAPLASRLDLPPWANSAMDGFAVQATDTAAADKQPVSLAVVGEAAAGRRASGRVEPGTALRILTGAPLPEGADAVVPVEDTDAPMGAGAPMPSQVVVRRPAAPGEHVRALGSDLRAGEELLDPGTELGAAELALAAAGGHAELLVHPRPRVAILATGDELVAPGAPLGEAQIPDSNSVGLLAQAREAGAEARSLGIAGDRFGDVVARLRGALASAEVIVVSGGVSVGAHDVVKDAFAELGTLELWRIAVQPGKPLAFARADRPGGQGTVLLFGLPGNPVSSFVTFELFVRPVLRRLRGLRDLSGRSTVRARLSGPVSKSPGRRAFLRVRLGQLDGGWLAELSGGQSSHVLSALAAADGLAVVAEELEGLPTGAEVDVIRLRGWEGR